MKTILTPLFAIAIGFLNAQNMKEPSDVVIEMFVATDRKDWNAVENSFAPSVILDYSSFTGESKKELNPHEIVTSWKSILPKFESTHHQIGNIVSHVEKKSASVSVYGTATHYLEHEHGNIWTVVGTYDFELLKESQGWKINNMVFNFKYEDGNTLLPHYVISGSNDKSQASGKLDHKISVEQFFRYLEEENVDNLAELFAEDGIHINPYHSNIFPKGAQGRSGIKAYWSPVFPSFEGMSFHIEEMYSMDNQSMVYVKYRGDIQLKNGAGIYSNEYYSTFKFNKTGEIIEYVELFNPIVAAKGFGLLEKIKG
ncbi:nuclear transport factor 2 family protein [Cytophaga sp. FL35]|uniref:nuclear transport factor 2 family protein n=1 Tax=Cytophaga sp. FL35 TaxID=1904456 RepID=UPI0016535E99|nr:nuclear transport factor 2 family protein [Cytophaga sp. FL35]MBC6999822.1 nuclear transport factor 2 family protein [Cytophaga sp. FL35]